MRWVAAAPRLMRTKATSPSHALGAGPSLSPAMRRRGADLLFALFWLAPMAEGETAGEFERIRRYFAPLAGPGGLGLRDDAALVECGAGPAAGDDRRRDGRGRALSARRPARPGRQKAAAGQSVGPGGDGRAAAALPVDDGAAGRARARNGSPISPRGLGEDQRQFGVALLGGDSVATTGPGGRCP